jgi:hypothetical protein
MAIRLLLATHNLDKARIISGVLKKLRERWIVKSLSDIGVATQFEERGDLLTRATSKATFYANFLSQQSSASFDLILGIDDGITIPRLSIVLVESGSLTNFILAGNRRIMIWFHGARKLQSGRPRPSGDITVRRSVGRWTRPYRCRSRGLSFLPFSIPVRLNNYNYGAFATGELARPKSDKTSLGLPGTSDHWQVQAPRVPALGTTERPHGQQHLAFLLDAALSYLPLYQAKQKRGSDELEYQRKDGQGVPEAWMVPHSRLSQSRGSFCFSANKS